MRTYSDLVGQLHLIEFTRGSKSLGLSLAGNRDLGVMSVFVVGIQPNSPTASDGRIKVGDELLEVSLQKCMLWNIWSRGRREAWVVLNYMR